MWVTKTVVTNSKPLKTRGFAFFGIDFSVPLPGIFEKGVPHMKVLLLEIAVKKTYHVSRIERMLRSSKNISVKKSLKPTLFPDPRILQVVKKYRVSCTNQKAQIYL